MGHLEQERLVLLELEFIMLASNIFSVNGPEIVSQDHGESGQALHDVFAKASQATPAVVGLSLSFTLFTFTYSLLLCICIKV